MPAVFGAPAADIPHHWSVAGPREVGVLPIGAGVRAVAVNWYRISRGLYGGGSMLMLRWSGPDTAVRPGNL